MKRGAITILSKKLPCSYSSNYHHISYCLANAFKKRTELDQVINMITKLVYKRKNI